MNKDININTNQKNYPYKLTPFKLAVLQNFPYIEADFDALTDYGLLCKVVEYLNNVIANQNVVQDNVSALNNAFTELKNYIDTYFDAELTERVDAKLNEFAENGTLEQMIAKYINNKFARNYNTVSDMKSDIGLIAGMYSNTLGYHTIFDGGNASYFIRNKLDSELIDESFTIALSNDLVAELVIDNDTVNIKQLGALSENDSNFKHIDIKKYLDIYENKIDSNNSIKLYIPSGIYCCSEKHFTKNVNIFGDLTFYHNYNKTKGTIITSLFKSQQYIWKFGGNPNFESNSFDILRNINLTDITFSSGLYSNNTGEPDSLNEITHACLYLDGISFSIIPNIFFNYIYGTAFAISTSWELYFDNLNFRNIYNHNMPVLLFDAIHSVNNVNHPNISACNFNNMMFEVCNGNYIQFDINCGFDNNHIGYINAECSFANGYQDDGSISNADNSEIDSYTHESLFAAGNIIQLSIDSILIQLIGATKHTVSNNMYVLDYVFNHKFSDSEINSFYDGSIINATVGLIDYEYNNIPIYIIKQDVAVSYRSNIVINTIKCNTTKSALISIPQFNVYQYPSITINNILAISQSSFINHNNIIDSYLYKPCYNYAIKSYGLMSLVSDNECTNPLKIAIKRFDNQTGSSVMILRNFNKEKIKIRMKIPKDLHTQLFLSGAISGNFDPVTGTGSYEWYTFDCSDKDIDSTKDLTISCNNTNTLFDCIEFY